MLVSGWTHHLPSIPQYFSAFLSSVSNPRSGKRGQDAYWKSPASVALKQDQESKMRGHLVALVTRSRLGLEGHIQALKLVFQTTFKNF